MYEIIIKLYEKLNNQGKLKRTSILYVILLNIIVVFAVDYISPLRSVKVKRAQDALALREALSSKLTAFYEKELLANLLEETLKDKTYLEYSSEHLSSCWTYHFSAFHIESLIGIIITIVILARLLFKKKQKFNMSSWISVFIIAVLTITYLEVCIFLTFCFLKNPFSELYNTDHTGFSTLLLRITLLFIVTYVISKVILYFVKVKVVKLQEK